MAKCGGGGVRGMRSAVEAAVRSCCALPLSCHELARRSMTPPVIPAKAGIHVRSQVTDDFDASARKIPTPGRMSRRQAMLGALSCQRSSGNVQVLGPAKPERMRQYISLLCALF